MANHSVALLEAYEKEKYRLVAENQNAYALMCKFPLNDEHVIILPKRLVASFLELTSSEARDFLHLVNQTARAIQEKTALDPVVVQNYGEHSSIEHIHFHVLTSNANLRTLYTTSHGGPRRQQRSVEGLTANCENLKRFMS